MVGSTSLGNASRSCLSAPGLCIFGRLLSFGHLDDTELSHCTKKAWSKFHQYRSDLIGHVYALKDKLRLFEAVVTPSVLYGCSTWTMTKDGESRLKAAQRQMLRRIVKVARLKEASHPMADTSGSSSDASDDDADVPEIQVEESYVD